MKLWTIGSTILPVAGLAAFGVTHMSSPPSIPQEREQAFATQIDQAKEARKNNQPDQALRLIRGIPSNSKHDKEAQTLQAALIPEVIEDAKTLHRQGNINPAIAMLQSIPAIAPGSQEAQALKVDWVKESRQIAEIQQEIGANRFLEAVTKINRLRGKVIFDSPIVQGFLQQALNNNGETLPLLAPNAVASATTATPPNVVVPRIPTVMPPPPPIRALAVNVDDAIASTNPNSVPQPVRHASSVPVIQPIPRAAAPVVVAKPNPRVNQVAIVTVPLLRDQTLIPPPATPTATASTAQLPTEVATSAQATSLTPAQTDRPTVSNAEQPQPPAALASPIPSGMTATPIQPSTALITAELQPDPAAQDIPVEAQRTPTIASQVASRVDVTVPEVASLISSQIADTGGESTLNRRLPTYIRANLYRVPQQSQTTAQSTTTRKQAAPIDSHLIEQMLSAQTLVNLAPDANLGAIDSVELLSSGN